MDNLTHLSRINFHPATASVHSGAALEVELILQCLMPIPVRIQQLAASIHFALEQVGTNGRSKAAQRQTSGGTVEFHQRSSSAAPPSSAPYVSLELEEIHDRSPTDNSLNSTGVVCKNTHLVIRRHDSSSPADTPSNLSPVAVTMKEGAQMLKVHDVTLQPGTNSIMFTAPVSVYSDGHLKSRDFFTTIFLFYFLKLKRFLSLVWTTRCLHAAPAVRISRPCTVCIASYLPICPVRSLFSGASTHRGTSRRSVSKHLTTNSFFHSPSSNDLLFIVLNCISVCVSCSGGCFLFSEPLLAGLPQTVKFTVLMGHYSLKKGDALQFSNTETMPILPSSSCTAHIRNPAAGSCTF